MKKVECQETPMRVNRRRLLIAAAGASACAYAQPALASYPSRPIKLVVPYPAGGPNDITARLIAEGLRRMLGQPGIVINQPGGAATIGTRTVATADPDGYTLLLGSNQTHGANPLLMKNPGYDAFRDFVPIIGIARLQHMLVVRKGHAARDLRELIALGRQGRLTYGSSGNGSGSHLAAELFKKTTGIVNAVHVPYRGSAQVLPDMLGGRLDFWFATLPGVLSHIRDGSLEAYAVASHARSPGLPHIPTLAEQGVTDCEADAWSGLFAPAKVAPKIVQQLVETTTATFKDPAGKARMIESGFLPELMPPDAFARFMHDEMARWAEVIRTANITVE
ncbi:MAG: tripartite tricarboxylate transporter substrate binding protein [Ottowia sp.]|uniref:Bug family tripartite tricarboxylate transporter substrate binding protein n=1 Tax=Ottowia sp. TaxID=1898956 RepID=UPI0039E416C8